MQSYNILENEYLPEMLKNKPRWMFCAIIAMSLLLLTLSAVLVGVFIGYMYCYIEQRSGKVPHSANFQIIRTPLLGSNIKSKRGINEAIESNILVSRILKMGRTLIEDELNLLQWPDDENKSDNLKVFL